MVRFCNKCKRAVDDLDKFCRSCGHNTEESIDYHTYYRCFNKDDQLLWFMKGADIGFRQEMKEIKEKVDLMYQKLFPPSVGELREEFDRVFKKKEEHTEEKPVEKSLEKDEHKEVLKKEDDIKKEDRSEDRSLQEKEENNEEKPVVELPEKKEDHNEEKPVVGPPEKKDETIKEDDIKKEDNIVSPYIDNPNLIDATEILENNDLNEKLLREPSEEKENWPWPEETTGEEISKKQTEKEIPEEVNDKLGMLLQEDEGHRQAVQYLIDRYSKKNKGKNVDNIIDNDKSNDKSPVDTNTGPTIAIIPSEDVVRIGRVRGKGKEKGEPYKMYDVAIHPFIPDILKIIEGSKDGMIRVRLLDIAKKMGEKFVDKKPVTIYTGLKYTLFEHKIVVEMGSLKEVDPVTKENIKILKMRMRNPDDSLPPSLLERRGEME
jgi:hypothetical protein